MYGKLKQLSIEELEVEIEDLDLCIAELYKERDIIMIQMKDLEKKLNEYMNKIVGLRALSKMCSDLILEKQREEAQ